LTAEGPGATLALVEEGAPPAAPGDKLVLIVDDDPLIRDLLELTLTGAGFKVLLAVDGHDATAKLDKAEPHLIITDLMMPGQGGYEFIRMLPGAGAGRTPVVVVSASALDQSTIGMIKQEANVVDFFSKPIKMNALIMALHKHLGTAPLASQSRGLNDRP
jgi:CheY-like chemotaxis protein